MKVHLWAFGATTDPWLQEGEKIYTKRIERYLPFEYKTVQPSRDTQPAKVLSAESKWLQNQLQQAPSRIILLDEKGVQHTSEQFARKLELWRQGTHRRLIFLIGSAYGFDNAVRNMADEMLSVSSMTLPHQICRLVFLEQIYRACTILRGEAYHHP